MFCGAGFVIGVAVCYGAYRYYQRHKNMINQENLQEDTFGEKLKEKELETKKYDELIANQSYVEMLTSGELTKWFKENYSQFPVNTKMLIVVPNDEFLRGLGYPINNGIDVERNILQLFYDENESKVLKIRLVNFTDIDSNLQALLIEQEGMIVVTN